MFLVFAAACSRDEKPAPVGSNTTVEGASRALGFRVILPISLPPEAQTTPTLTLEHDQDRVPVGLRVSYWSKTGRGVLRVSENKAGNGEDLTVEDRDVLVVDGTRIVVDYMAQGLPNKVLGEFVSGDVSFTVEYFAAQPISKDEMKVQLTSIVQSIQLASRLAK
jgi:hypothetical protein